MAPETMQESIKRGAEIGKKSRAKSRTGKMILNALFMLPVGIILIWLDELYFGIIIIIISTLGIASGIFSLVSKNPIAILFQSIYYMGSAIVIIVLYLSLFKDSGSFFSNPYIILMLVGLLCFNAYNKFKDYRKAIKIHMDK